MKYCLKLETASRSAGCYHVSHMRASHSLRAALQLHAIMTPLKPNYNTSPAAAVLTMLMLQKSKGLQFTRKQCAIKVWILKGGNYGEQLWRAKVWS